MKISTKNKNLFKLFEPLVITFFWLLLFLAPIIMDDGEYGMNWDAIITNWARIIPYLIIFLINRFLLLPYLFFKNRRGLFLLSVLVLITVVSFGDFYFQENYMQVKRGVVNDEPQHRRPEFMVPPEDDVNAMDDAFLPDDKLHRPSPGGRPGLDRPPMNAPGPQHPRQFPPFISFALIALLVVGFDTGINLSVQWVNSEQKRMNAEKESVKSQLAFLRNQVSPHFFMNTLNNIHSLIDFDTEEAKESIIRLSKLMRHLLYESEKEKIPIQKEVEFIENYVDLMRMRFSEQVEINVSLLNPMPNKSIPPLLFTSYVENAFKHGISYQNKSFVNITFGFEADAMMFEVKNSKSEKKKSDGEMGGIGTENSRKRLDLLYNENYSLKIEDTDSDFAVNLVIPI